MASSDSQDDLSESSDASDIEFVSFTDEDMAYVRKHHADYMREFAVQGRAIAQEYRASLAEKKREEG